MPAIRYKWGGGWSGDVANGKLSTKWGGGWFIPTVIYAKVGALGGGYWTDTGYRGYPAVPSAPWVHAWSYDAIALGWSAGGGGAPATAYQLVQTDVNGNWINQVEVGGSPWGNFGMSWDTRYQFYVRAKSAAGLYSGFAGPLRVGCGHPTQYTYGNVQRSRAWAVGSNVGDGNGSWGFRDNLFGEAVGGDIVVNGIYWDLYTNVGIMSPWGNRTMEIIGNEGQYVWGPMDWQASHINGWDYFGHWGNGGRWGGICRGAGWSSQFWNNGYPRVWGYLEVHGTQYYYNWEVVSTINEQGNYYW